MPITKYKVQSASVAVQLPPQMTQSTCASLIRALIKHLLYTRGHIPYLYDQLLVQAAASLEELQRRQLEEQSLQPGRRPGRRRLKKSDKLRLQFLQRTEALLESIVPQLFSTRHPTRCYVLLGASTLRPREAYEVVVPPAPTPGGEEQGPAAAARDDYACRLLLRQLITSTPDLPEGTAAQRVGKVFFLVEALPGQAPPAGFAIKRGFGLAQRKGVHVTLLLGEGSLQSQEEEKPRTPEQQRQKPGQHAAQVGQQREAGAAALQEETENRDPAAGAAQQAFQAAGHPWAAALAGEAHGNAEQPPAAVWLQSKFVLRGLKSGSTAGSMG